MCVLIYEGHHLFSLCCVVALQIRMSDEFYSLFYLGLFCESRGEPSKAESYMRAAAKSQYAQGTGSVDYMTACAKIHCQLRHWA
jgi:hypothetical protein